MTVGACAVWVRCAVRGATCQAGLAATTSLGKCRAWRQGIDAGRENRRLARTGANRRSRGRTPRQPARRVGGAQDSRVASDARRSRSPIVSGSDSGRITRIASIACASLSILYCSRLMLVPGVVVVMMLMRPVLRLSLRLVLRLMLSICSLLVAGSLSLILTMCRMVLALLLPSQVDRNDVGSRARVAESPLVWRRGRGMMLSVASLRRVVAAWVVAAAVTWRVSDSPGYRLSVVMLGGGSGSDTLRSMLTVVRVGSDGHWKVVLHVKVGIGVVHPGWACIGSSAKLPLRDKEGDMGLECRLMLGVVRGSVGHPVSRTNLPW